LKLAAGYYIHQDPDNAQRVLQRVQEQAREDERVVNLLARVQMRRLENKAAIDALEPLVRRFPNRPSALRLLADAYLRNSG